MYDRKNPLSCNSAKFVNRDYSDLTEPIFMVYSYNPEIDNINYSEIADELIENILSASDGAAPAVSVNSAQRRKRQTPTCKVNELQVSGSSIFNKMVGSTASDFSVLIPQDYNAGICGGSCETKLIPYHTSKHAPFIFLLLEQSSFKEKHSYTFTRCCAPVKYGPLQVFSISNGSTNIFTIEDMIIEKCQCLDIIDLS